MRTMSPEMHDAIVGWNLEVFMELEQAGESLFAPDQRGYSALHLACSVGCIDIAAHVLDAGVPIDLGTHQDSWGRRTPLLLAVVNNWPAMCEMLLQRGADPNESDNPNTNHQGPLFFCVENGFDEVAKVLLDHGAEVTSFYSVDVFNPQNNRTLLQRAAEMGRTNIVALLIAHGAEVDEETQRWLDRRQTPSLLRFVDFGCPLVSTDEN